jgi:hypothetical protein
MRRQLAAAATFSLLALATAGCGAANTLTGVPKEPKPMAVTEGKAFSGGHWAATQGWSVTQPRFLGYGVKMTVTNTSNDPYTAIYTVKLLRGSFAVASIDCMTGELEAGQSTQAECAGTVSGRPKYSSITVKNAIE